MLLVRSIQAKVFSSLNEALKDILYEANFRFDSSGISIKAINKSHSQFVHLELQADKFETFYCKAPLTLGIDLLQMHKLLHGITTDDTLVLSMSENNTTILKIQILNEHTQVTKEYDLKLLDIDDQQSITNKIPYNNELPQFIIGLGTTRFKSICKELLSIGTMVEIICTNLELRFQCKGLGAKGSQIVSLAENNPHIYKRQSCNDIIQGMFSLKTLCQFTKFTSLGGTLELCLTNDKPISLRYTCADLGFITLFLAPFDEV